MKDKAIRRNSKIFNVGINVSEANEINKKFKAENMLSPKEKEIKARNEKNIEEYRMNDYKYDSGEEP